MSDSWASRAGFVLASVGAAVGLGNVWQFPFKTAQFGGASFLVVYLASALAVGVPAVLAEFAVGRHGGRNTAEPHDRRNVAAAFEAFGGRRLRLVAGACLFACAWTFSYYTVVGGWVLRYAVGSVTGGYLADPAGYFAVVATGVDAVAFHGVFVAVAVAVVAGGVEDGIEAASKLLVPAIVVVFGGLAVYAFTLDGASVGYAYFLSPDVDQVLGNLGRTLPFALGQTFFSLSVGVGTMVTYATYVDDGRSLVRDGLLVVALDTFVGVLAGFVVFPLLFAQGIDPASSGAGAVFVGVAGAFADLPGGQVVGVAFFLAASVAALSTAIGMLEVLVAVTIPRSPFGRAGTAIALGGGVFLLGTPAALSTDWFVFVDTLAYELVLPAAVLVVLVGVGWLGGERATATLFEPTSRWGRVWLWTLRVVGIGAVGITVLLGLVHLVGGVPFSM